MRVGVGVGVLVGVGVEVGVGVLVGVGVGQYEGLFMLTVTPVLVPVLFAVS